MKTEIENKEIMLFPSRSADAPLVVLNTYDGGAEEIYREICKITNADFSLCVIGKINWDDEMSPWAIPAISKYDTPCTGGADKYLELLVNRIIPGAINLLGKKPSCIAIAGYSLAGLFAVYSAYKADIFSKIASASGSFWFPDFLDFAFENEMKHEPECIYFSLGDKEAKTRNKILQPVQDNTQKLFEYYSEKGIKSTFELNPGNHFSDGAIRTAKAVKWILEN